MCILQVVILSCLLRRQYFFVLPRYCVVMLRSAAHLLISAILLAYKMCILFVALISNSLFVARKSFTKLQILVFTPKILIRNFMVKKNFTCFHN